ncbi:putative [acyl-carrier-protein] S-malonyltransferase [Peptostreptococcaceae bacterium AS15]|nr:putative [acyl-carrier-protein] S-malonyltransferase [[Eubacterium] yurii subsp. margaretiae ATCC 43715]EJP21715.1 putative [acyl-carrier-protein] S-malonyltransferase [Peptostreptococcaceae bacterium AS15]
MKICFLYGGQGSQKTGMGKDLYENYPVFKEFYDSLSTNFDLKDYSFNQSDEEISKTQYTQPLMVAFQIGITKILKDKGINPDIVGGLSIGEYSALYTSGVITDKDAILIAEKRGIAMSNSSDVKCKMMAIVGAPVDLVRDVCEKVSEKTGYPVQISNLNCPGQIVIAGEENAIDEVVLILKENKIRKIIQLNVSGAFHTSYMEKASLELENIFKEIEFSAPNIDLGLNVDGRIYDVDGYTQDDIKNIMVKQVKSTVYFEEELRNMISKGVDVFVEIGFSSVIKGFLKKIDSDKKVYEVYSVETLEDFVKEINN